MSNVVAISDRFRPAQLALIQRMNPDCSPDEFNVFMSVAASLGLDPLRKQIYAFVFGKDNPEKRRMSLVVGIDGFRAIAARSGDYRPDDRAPRITMDERAVNPDTNPLGIISAEVTVYKRVHGDWWPITAVAFWDEHAPLVESGTWEKNANGKSFFKGTGKYHLDPKKDTWRKMARLMLAKCAEASAIRRGWPEDLSAIYADEELDRAKTLDLTATEIAEKANVESRLAMIGGVDAILFDMGDGLERIPLGKAADMILDRFKSMQPHEVLQWRNINKVTFNEFWARAKTDALAVKREIERIEKGLEA
jgi:phage recombination protein Bet